MPRVEVQSRLVWQFNEADGNGLSGALLCQDWSWLSTVDANTSTEQLTATILTLSEYFISRRWLKERKSTHPWINDRVLEVVKEKIRAEGTDAEEECRKRCSTCIMEEYGKYIDRERNHLRELPRGSKSWWSRSRRLMEKKGVVSSIPALKDPESNWVVLAREKANLFAATVSRKYKLSNEEANEYTPLSSSSSTHQRTLKTLGETDAKEIMDKLRVDSGTGPDLLPARILKNCSAALAKPVLSLTLVILSSGIWQDLWRQHWVVPLYKKKSVFHPGNYRGIHLTAQLSKVVERLLKLLYFPHVMSSLAFGPHQFAYTTGRGARDALALLVSAVAAGRKVAVYCSDVSGAFDRVQFHRMVAKLRTKGLHPDIIAVLVSWLKQRLAEVVVGGSVSDKMTLINMVYQGTVTGPILWNLFFEDACNPINECFFKEVVYADDLNAYRVFASDILTILY